MDYSIGTRSQSLLSSQPPSAQIKDPLAQKTPQTIVTCVYQTHIAGFWRNATVLWSKNLMNHSLSISVDSAEQETASMCKIDLKPWHFWAKKGYKTFEVDGTQLEAYWDLRSAKFSGSPEPSADFYVALVSDEEVVLLLEIFLDKAKFDERKREHEIVVESSTTGPRDPEMWISIDGIVLIHIKNLQWKFRGNQTVQVDKQTVQVFWDVHAWLFCAPGSNYGLFIFKPGDPDADSDGDDSSRGDDSECSGNSRYYSTQSYSKGTQFCLFLYAWKIE
ncbi:UNVERIFIED_CONTAM: hypothetical protein Sradi_1036000 [Sesamum radiatum]|uniref:DUF868 family protein n=1 Tax=Sesamum radiatum TaxID=300843 RepID=A0AAW2V9I8_SESRA